MCGIIGYAGDHTVIPFLLKGLKQLEYRGYDSSGIAFFFDHHIQIVKSQGRIVNIEKLIEEQNQDVQSARVGIGHTRWATHGKPTTENAHPHRAGPIVLVHNGIIENYLELRREVLAHAVQLKSETDTELFGYLILNAMKTGLSLLESIRLSFKKLKGKSSFVILSEQEPDCFIAISEGSPLIVAEDPRCGGALVASDPQALVDITHEFYFLAPDEIVVGSRAGLKFYQLSSLTPIVRKPTTVTLSSRSWLLNGYEHFMLKEIHEQPEAFRETLEKTLGLSAVHSIQGMELDRATYEHGIDLLEKATHLILVASGTSWHACLLAQYWIEQFTSLNVRVELSSEFRYRSCTVMPGTVVCCISQSGETADTLAVIQEMQKQGVPVLGICNVPGSSLTRLVKTTFYTYAGPEIGVAATKTLITQMLVLFLIALHLNQKSRLALPVTELQAVWTGLLKLPHLLEQMLSPQSGLKTALQTILQGLTQARGFFFIGRGYCYPIALEGALKLKEIAYEHAEGYAAGELKHGPIAMIDPDMVLIALVSRGLWRSKTISNLEEVKARGAKIFAIGHAQDDDLKLLSDFWMPLPQEIDELPDCLVPFLMVPLVQLFSYYRALWQGTDVDKPRNLAKSVTVE